MPEEEQRLKQGKNLHEYTKSVLQSFERIMQDSRIVFKSGYDVIQVNSSHTYPINGYIQSSSRLIVIETRTQNILSIEEIQQIIHTRFRPICQKRPIFAILESYHGYQSCIFEVIREEKYPLLLTQQLAPYALNQAGLFHGLKPLLNSMIMRARFPEGVEEQPKLNYEMLSYILSGETRVKIVWILFKKPNYPYMISQEVQVDKSSVLKVLRDLEDKGIVECTTPLRKRRRIYHLTTSVFPLHNEIKNYLDSITEKKKRGKTINTHKYNATLNPF